MQKQQMGKRFEEAFKKSVPEYCLVQRLHDAPQAFSQSNLTKFAPKSPCDFFLFDTISRLLYCIECKSTQYKTMSYEDIYSDEKQNKMIHKHQIIALTKFSDFDNVVAGFLINFRDEEKRIERTYFQEIKNFNDMCLKIDKKSFNEIDLIQNKAVKVQGNLVRVNYSWDIDGFLRDYGTLQRKNKN